MRHCIIQSLGIIGSAIAALALWPHTVAALPPPEDTPEEVLRTEIILDARSPLDGTPLTAAEYEQLREALGRHEEPLVSSELRELIFLLQLRRVVKPIFPFVP